ncbi:hypothetical protein [Methylocapsa aurea]|uniref:hypothetical protein n=1 Tax=Methylocapsa aurea TaxID=663610 RepID=UPI0012EC92F1|nr:hypothetical protein [Methylocapsa aurea]
MLGSWTYLPVIVWFAVAIVFVAVQSYHRDAARQADDKENAALLALLDVQFRDMLHLCSEIDGSGHRRAGPGAAEGRPLPVRMRRRIA